MTAEQIDELARAAELHDIGKVGLPDAILDKPGALDPDEWEFIRQHTILGERILSAAPALRPVATIVRASHERWDGRGYPDRLCGDEIPLAARIVAVCDAYEAITDDRCYREARSAEVARTELLRESGRQFDPEVVAAFLSELEEPQVGIGLISTADEEEVWRLAGEVVERFTPMLESPVVLESRPPEDQAVLDRPPILESDLALDSALVFDTQPVLRAQAPLKADRSFDAEGAL
jgi:HD-GYP domain-containing protein (c-di-GMP phosphodiesterase class II)